MAGSPDWKVYSVNGEYIASCKYAEDAAALVSVQGNGASISYRHGRKLWIEGHEAIPAGESYDTVSVTVEARRNVPRTDWK